MTRAEGDASGADGVKVAGDTTASSGEAASSDLESIALLLAQVWSRPAGRDDGPVVLPERVGRFEVRGLAGRGGFGLVLRAYDPHMKRAVALKIPRPDRPLDADARRRSLAEARTTAGLDDPRIVPVYEAGEAGPIPYIASAFCDGPDLARWLKMREMPLPRREAARLVTDLAEAVAHAHRRGVLHLDLKPGNVLLDLAPGGHSPKPRITDFGLGGPADGPDGAFPDAPFGTLWYMAPEQAGGRSAEVGPATDVHGLGTILYELIAGSPPFHDRDRARALDRVRSEVPTLPPGDLEAIALACLRKSPADRYASAQDLADDLRRFLAGEPILARPAPPWKKARSWARRRPIRAATLAVLLIAAGLTPPVLLEAGRRAAEARWLVTSVRLQRMERAAVASLPEILTGLDLGDPRARAWLGRLFDRDDPGPKLAAAVALAPFRADCRDHAIDGLLAAPPSEVGALARVLQDRIPDLAGRLEGELDRPREIVSGTPPDGRPLSSEGRDARLANAAAALVLIDSPARAWPMLRTRPNPQPRSMLIHRLGPAGVRPQALLDRLRVESDASARRALILAWGEASTPAREGGTSREAPGWLLDFYRDDPDPGVHGAAKWALRRSAPAGALAALDVGLARDGYRDGFGWRIGRSGLTFVRVDDPRAGRAFEIGDVEVSRSAFLGLFPKHRINLAESPTPDCPMLGVNYLEAAAFCNKLSLEDGIESGQLCYPDPPTLATCERYDPARVRDGYRLPTDRELELACRAGTTSRYYFGDSPALLAHYAWFSENAERQSHPGASLKPNDLGLFDTLGNAYELCQATGDGVSRTRQAVYRGGFVMMKASSMACGQKSQTDLMNHEFGNEHIGFRVARYPRAGRDVPP